MYNGAPHIFGADAAQQLSCVMYMYVYLIGGNGHNKCKNLLLQLMYTQFLQFLYFIAMKISPMIYTASTAVSPTMSVHEGRVPPYRYVCIGPGQ